MIVRKTIRDFIQKNFLKGDKSISLIDGDSLLEARIIDSVGVLELVAFLEKKFNFKVEDEEIVPENFDSIDKLVIFVQSKSGNKKS